MSAAEKLVPVEPTPEEQAWTAGREPEAVRVRREDPDFPVVRARVLARSRGETYRPEVHGPFAEALPPRQARRKASGEAQPVGNLEVKLSEIIGRFAAKGEYRYRPRIVRSEEATEDRRYGQ